MSTKIRITPAQRQALDQLRSGPAYTSTSTTADVLAPLRALVAKGLAVVVPDGRGQRWTVAS